MYVLCLQSDWVCRPAYLSGLIFPDRHPELWHSGDTVKLSAGWLSQPDFFLFLIPPPRLSCKSSLAPSICITCWVKVEWPCACIVSTKKVCSSFRLVAILFAWADPYILHSRFPSELVLKISQNMMASKRTSKAPRQDWDTKKPRISQKFLLDYTTNWPVLKLSMKVATFCYCCTCRQL